MGILDGFMAKPPTSVAVQTDLTKQMEELAAKEAAAKAARMVPPGLEEAIHVIDTCSAVVIGGTALGWPTLVKDAAQATAIVKRLPYEGQGLAGSGQLAALEPFSEPAQIMALAAELRVKGIYTPPTNAAPLPKDAPKSDPEAATAPVVVTPAVTPPPVTPATVTEEAPRTKRKYTKRAKTDTSPVTTGDDFCLFVDCHPNIPTESLTPHVMSAVADLQKRYDVIDLRAAGKHETIGYMQWRGVLSAYLKELVTTGKIPAAAYTIQSGTDFGDIAIEVLQDMVDLYVR